MGSGAIGLWSGARKMFKMGKKQKKRSWKWRLLTHPKILGLLVIALYFVVNFAVQLYRKPAEIFSFAAKIHYKTPEESWSAYHDYFVEAEKYGLRAELLAALAQAESSGSPWATPRWTFHWPREFFDLYRPQSSAVGLFQFTNGTYEKVRQACPAGSDRCVDLGWTPPTRLSAAESIERAAQNLHRELLLIAPKNPKSWNELAPIIHLCGTGIARQVARHGMPANLHCGPHNARAYVQEISALARRMEKVRAR
jgi:hypothetical protein